MSDTITLTLTFDRQHLEGIARSYAMLRQEPSLPISTNELRAALDAQEVPQPLQPIDDKVEAFRKKFFERTGERLQRTAVVEGLRAALGPVGEEGKAVTLAQLRRLLLDPEIIDECADEFTEGEEGLHSDVARSLAKSLLRLATERAETENEGEDNGTGKRQPEDERESTEEGAK
jgi:hypothetical protein